jgi:hypothetical protein
VHIGCLVDICSNGIMGMVIVIYNGNAWLMVNNRRISPTMGNEEWHSITRCISLSLLYSSTLYSIPKHHWAGIRINHTRSEDREQEIFKQYGKHQQRRYHGVEEGRGQLGCKSLSFHICQLGPTCFGYSSTRGD